MVMWSVTVTCFFRWAHRKPLWAFFYCLSHVQQLLFIEMIIPRSLTPISQFSVVALFFHFETNYWIEKYYTVTVVKWMICWSYRKLTLKLLLLAQNCLNCDRPKKFDQKQIFKTQFNVLWFRVNLTFQFSSKLVSNIIFCTFITV